MSLSTRPNPKPPNEQGTSWDQGKSLSDETEQPVGFVFQINCNLFFTLHRSQVFPVAQSILAVVCVSGIQMQPGTLYFCLLT